MKVRTCLLAVIVVAFASPVLSIQIEVDELTEPKAAGASIAGKHLAVPEAGPEAGPSLVAPIEWRLAGNAVCNPRVEVCEE